MGDWADNEMCIAAEMKIVSLGGMAELCIVLEPGRVLDSPSIPKLAQNGGLKSYFKNPF
jgi:hypothetical protein